MISSSFDSEEIVEGSKLGLGSLKAEQEESVALLVGDRDSSWWTPGTPGSKATSVTEQLSRIVEVNSKATMARETEKRGLENVMELMLQMRADDKKGAQLREEKREREERQKEVDRLDGVARIETQEREKEAERREREAKREEEREAREARLLTALRQAQPAVPQMVNINRMVLPKMGEKDDPVTIIRYLETALVRAKVPPAEWKDHVQPQLTLQAGEMIIEVLENADSIFEDIKVALMGVDAMSFASTAEAIFNPFKGGEKPSLRVLSEKVKGWVKKLIQEAETEAEIVEN